MSPANRVRSGSCTISALIRGLSTSVRRTSNAVASHAFSDHVIALSRVVDSVRECTGRDVHLVGYSQGGMFCYETAAYRRSEGLASVITLGSAVDSLSGCPSGYPRH